MKNKLLSLLLLGAVSISFTNCNNSGFKEKSITVTIFGLKTSFESKAMFNEKSKYIPYYSIDKFYKDFLSTTVEKKDNIYTFKNSSNDSSMTLDVSTGEMKYDSFSLYCCTGSTPHIEITEDNFYIKSKILTDETKYTKGKEYKINLKDYNLAPVKINNEYYLPLDVLYNLGSINNFNTGYFDGDKNLTILDSISYTDFKDYKTIDYPSSFYEYNYDLFTFRTDLIFGLNGFERPLRCNNNARFTYNKEGARKTFEKYRSDLINSKSIKDFDKAFHSMVHNELDDGGHTRVLTTSFGVQNNDIPDNLLNPKEFLYIDENSYEKEKSKRKNAAASEKMNEYVTGFDTDSDGHNDIGYVFLPGFSDESKDGWNIKSVLEQANNSFNKNNGNSEAQYIKDVVIDLAHNTGGSTNAEGALLSFICNGKGRQLLKDARDDSTTYSVVAYDINSDSNYDAKDYLPKDVNIYVLSDATYSAGCAAVFDTYMWTQTDEYKSLNKKIIFGGKPNQGGACSITNPIIIPTGLSYQTSYTGVGVYWKDYSKTCDEILNPTTGWDMTIDQICNRTGYINPKIVGAR